MPVKKPTARKTTTRKPARKPTAAQTRRTKLAARPPRKKGIGQRLGTWLASKAAIHAETTRVRKDAAILRATHAGCATCHGTGTIFTKDKHGVFTGSKPCPAKPTTMKVSKTHVHRAARFGPDKHSGLIGWTCPCGAKEKPRYHDAKTATAAIRTHERKKHGGRTIGAAWYAQLPEQTNAPAKEETKEPIVKMSKNTGMTDEQWEAQNGKLSPAAAMKRGLCWQCSGKGALYTAFGGEQKTVVCNECEGTGKAVTTAAA